MEKPKSSSLKITKVIQFICSRKILVFTIIVILFAVAAAIRFLGHQSTRSVSGVRDSLARALGIPPADRNRFFLNLPPRENCYPGTIIPSGRGPFVDPVSESSPLLVRGQPMPLKARENAKVTGHDELVSEMFAGALSIDGTATITIQIEELRVVDAKNASEIKQRVLQSKEGLTLYDKGDNPLVVIRSYEGTLVISVSTDGQSSARANSNVKGYSVATQSGTENNNEIIYRSEKPVVFAFEAQSVEYVTGHLGSEPTSVSLNPVRANAGSLWERTQRGEATGRSNTTSQGSGLENTPMPDQRNLGVITISSGFYQHAKSLNQAWNEESAEIFESSILKSVAPKPVLYDLRSSMKNGLTASGVLDFVRSSANDATKRGLDQLLIYYVGHQITLKSKGILLLMGDISRSDLAIAADPAKELPMGLLQLEKVYKEIESANIPFVLLIDGCLQREDLNSFREFILLSEIDYKPEALLEMSREDFRDFTADMTPEERDEFVLESAKMDAIMREEMRKFDREFMRDDESNEDGAAEEAEFLEKFLQRTQANIMQSLLDQEIKQFREHNPYLNNKNPIIMAAAPGTYAFSATNPSNSTRPPVGPLAYDLYIEVQHKINRRERLLLSDLLRAITADVVPRQGRMKRLPKGSITWGDYNQFSKIFR